MTQSNPRRPLGLIYSAVTAFSIFLFVVLWTAIDIVRVDFVGTNPNRSQANAIFIALVEGPIVGVVIVLLGGSLCVAVAAITAKATKFLLGKVPLWMLPINTLVCGAAADSTVLARRWRLLPNTAYARRLRRRGGGLRHRWEQDNGTIYEWDHQHGMVEKYDRRGRHLGEFDPNAGVQTKSADSTRSVIP